MCLSRSLLAKASKPVVGTQLRMHMPSLSKQSSKQTNTPASATLPYRQLFLSGIVFMQQTVHRFPVGIAQMPWKVQSLFGPGLLYLPPSSLGTRCNGMTCSTLFTPLRQQFSSTFSTQVTTGIKPSNSGMSFKSNPAILWWNS